MMKNELIHTRTEIFEGLISQVKTACELSGHGIADHFAEVGKMIQLVKGGQNETSVTLLNRGIRPESLPPAEDVKKVEHRLTSAEKRALENPEGLEA